MKYLSINSIKIALEAIYQENTQEHITSRATNTLINRYFHFEKFLVSPERILDSRRRPDFTIEKINPDNSLSNHVFLEVKSAVSSNFDNIMDQLHDTILETVDSSNGIFVVFVIAMKGASIAFYEFHSYVGLLDECGIINYKGFVPLNFRMSSEQFFYINQGEISPNPEGFTKYLNYIRRININRDPEHLTSIGVKPTTRFPYPQIWNLLNKDHENYVHELFQSMANNDPGFN